MIAPSRAWLSPYLRDRAAAPRYAPAAPASLPASSGNALVQVLLRLLPLHNHLEKTYNNIKINEYQSRTIIDQNYLLHLT